MLAALVRMSLYSWLVGRPFVYDHVRPLIVGGVDAGPVFRKLDAGDNDVVLDVGCGTGDALRHLRAFGRYYGVDPDPTAVEHARRRFGQRANVTFRVGTVDQACLEEIAPSRAVLAGVLHHLSDEQAFSLLSLLRAGARLVRVVTMDIVCLEGERLSNALASLDRGAFCRRREGYERLARRSGWSVKESAVIRSHPTNGRALYLTMTLEP
jgi:SAM-dependent methyltransferase